MPRQSSNTITLPSVVLVSNDRESVERLVLSQRNANEIIMSNLLARIVSLESELASLKKRV